MYSRNNNKTEEHAFRKFQADVKNGSLKNVILLCGEEQYLIRWAKNTIIKAFINEATASMDLTSIDEKDASPQMIREVCETMSMMSERRVLEIIGYPSFADTRTGSKKDIGADTRAAAKKDTGADARTGSKSEGRSLASSSGAEEELVEYIKVFPEHAQLVIRGDPSRKQGKLYNAIKKYGAVYDFNMLDRTTLKGFIRKEFRKRKIVCSDKEINKLINDCGYLNDDVDYTLDQLVNDIEKICALAGGSEITSDDIENVIGESLEKNIFEFVDAVNSGAKNKAYKMLDNLLLSGENFYRILATVITSLETLYMIRELSEEGYQVREIGKILGKSPYYIKKLFDFARKMSLEGARKMLISAYEIDSLVKSGRMDDRFAMEFFIAEV